MSEFDLVIFDCDGTLVDSEALNNRSTAEVLAEIGLPQYTPDYSIENFIGRAQPEIWALIARETGRPLPEDINDRYIARVHQNREQYLKAAPDASVTVKAVLEHHMACVASNGERANVLSAVEGTGLSPFFAETHIFTAAQVENPKPAPDLFLHAAKSLGALPERTLVIEDSLVGASAGLAAGMRVYGYVGLSHQKDIQAERMRALGVHHVGDTLSEILTILNRDVAA